MNQIILAAVLAVAVIGLVVYFAFFRKRPTHSMTITPGGPIPQIAHAPRPTREQILNALVEFSDYPSFNQVITVVLGEFTMDYLYSYGELSRAFSLLVDFPKDGGGISPAQRAAMVTIIRVLMTSDFIQEKCGHTLDDHFDRFMEEAHRAS